MLITGAAGFVGGHLVGRLAPVCSRLVAWHRPNARLRPRVLEWSGAPPGDAVAHVVWDAVDTVNREAVRQAIRTLQPSVVYHCAGAAQVGSSWATTRETLEANALATHYVLDAVEREAPGARVLIPGSATVYRAADTRLGEDSPLGPGSPYAVSKLAQEMVGVKVAANGRVEALLPRAFNHVGPGQDPSFAAARFAREIARIEAGLSEPVLLVGNLVARRDLMDVRDTVDAYVLLVARGVSGRRYNVCTGGSYAIGDILDRLLSLARCPIEVRTDPALLRPSDVPVVTGDASRIERELGWRPVYSIDDTLRRLLDYWREIVGRKDS